MYAEDSFFTLTQPGQVGLALLSISLALVTIWVCWKLSRNRSLWVRLLIGILVFTGFIWLAPQVYYTYYVFLLEGLPWQFVVGWPPSPLDIARIITFQERANLSFHAQGILGWLLIGVAALRTRA